jgi:hypothetical protein
MATSFVKEKKTEQSWDKSPAVQEEKQLATPAQGSPKFGLDGEFDSSDMVKPYLNIAQAVAPLCQSAGWRAGDIVLGKEYGMFRDKLDPIKIIVCKADKWFLEDLPYGTEGMPRRFKSSEEVLHAGGTVNKGSFLPALYNYILIEKPSKIFDQDFNVVTCPSFTVELDGRSFALALYNLTSTAYGGAGKTIITAAMRDPQRRTYLQEFWLSSILQKSDKFSWFSPVIKEGPKNSAGFISTLEAKLTEF